jgi:hypothetical protein
MASYAQIKAMNDEAKRIRDAKIINACLQNMEARRKRYPIDAFWKKLSDSGCARERFIYIFLRLLNCQEGDSVKKSDIMAAFEVIARTVQKDMDFFREFNLISTQKGYKPTPKLFTLADQLRQEDPEKFNSLALLPG